LDPSPRIPFVPFPPQNPLACSRTLCPITWAFGQVPRPWSCLRIRIRFRILPVYYNRAGRWNNHYPIMHSILGGLSSYKIRFEYYWPAFGHLANWIPLRVYDKRPMGFPFWSVKHKVCSYSCKCTQKLFRPFILGFLLLRYTVH